MHRCLYLEIGTTHIHTHRGMQAEAFQVLHTRTACKASMETGCLTGSLPSHYLT